METKKKKIGLFLFTYYGRKVPPYEPGPDRGFFFLVEFFLAIVWLKVFFFLPLWEFFFFLPAILVWLGFNIITLVNDTCLGIMLWVSVKHLKAIYM